MVVVHGCLDLKRFPAHPKKELPQKRVGAVCMNLVPLVHASFGGDPIFQCVFKAFALLF